MRLILDANSLLSAIMGQRERPRTLVEAGCELVVVEAQLDEAARMLQRNGVDAETAQVEVETAASGAAIVRIDELQSSQAEARRRLHDRARPDWPVLAAALELDAAIWSDDRDFFGVGVPVWSTWALDRQPILAGTYHG